MTPGEIMLLVMAANGGEMTREDCFRECERIWCLSPEDQAEWRRRIGPLVEANARRALANGGDE